MNVAMFVLGVTSLAAMAGLSTWIIGDALTVQRHRILAALRGEPRSSGLTHPAESASFEQSLCIGRRKLPVEATTASSGHAVRDDLSDTPVGLVQSFIGVETFS